MGHCNRDALFRILILCGFSIFYLTSALSDKLDYYVHPRMVPYVLFSACVMLLIGGIVSKGVYRKERNFNPRSYVFLLIPLAAAWLIPPTSLAGASGIRSEYQSAAAVSRTMEPAETASVNSPSNPTAADLESGSLSLPIEESLSDLELMMKLDPISMEGSNYVAVLNALYDNFDQYIGRRVTTTGFVFRVQDFDADSFVPARMMMSCCTADAIPVGLMCSYESASGLEDGQWVTLVGTLSETEYNGEIIPVIEVSSLEKAEPMEDFVYP